MSKDKVLAEGRRLWSMGLAIHWLHAKSKRPIEPGWGSGPRKSWEYLKKTYKKGDNIGVRTGAPSKFENGYLACIDVDIKDPSFKAKALSKVKELTNGVKCPMVLSGSGTGSRHYYCVTKTPFKMITILKENGGEVCVYSSGRQMVLPPSETVQKYKWVNEIKSELPVCDFSAFKSVTKTKKKEKNEARDEDDGNFKVKFEDVELDWLNLPKKIVKGIKNGTNISDRSAYLMPCVRALISAGLTRAQILSVLTDSSTYMGKCAFDHAKTNNRVRAARWLYRYTVRKVETERSGKNAFEDIPITEAPDLSDDEIKTAEKKIPWESKIQRNGPNGDGPPSFTIENIVLILENAVSTKLVKRNEFAFRDTYGVKTPWGGKKNKLVTDDEVIEMKYWLGKNWGFEPSKDAIGEALTIIARRNAYDPVVDMLDALPAWDGKKRLDTWLKDHFEAKGDEDYLAQVFRKWMFAFVMRAKKPGAKFDWMPIFEGAQGIGKSSFGRLLVGDDVFLDWLPNLADKDSSLGLQGMWGVEMGELSNLRRSQIDDVKAYLTRTVDKVRPPYGKRWQESPRHCIFFGTTNRDKYLVDDSGNRRFKPVIVGQLDFKALKRDREQLFAEAKRLYDEGIEAEFTLELTGAAKEYEKKIHKDKMVEDESNAMKEAMQDFMKKVEKGTANFNREKFRILELFEVGGPLQKWRTENRNLQFAAKMLKSINAEKRLMRGLSYWRLPNSHHESSILKKKAKPPTHPDFY
jgi:predicted P-loop ATPase